MNDNRLTRGCRTAIAALLLLGALGAARDARAPLHACSKPAIGTGLCGRFAVPENRAHPNGRMIRLNVIYLPQTGPNPGDALATLAGGPGEGAASQISLYYTRPQLDRMRRTRPLLFVDSRGTGSSDAIDCPMLPHDAQSFFSTGMLDVPRLAACRKRLAKRTDLTQYTTDATVDDLDDVRAWLGLGKLILLGTSGGTLTAEIYARRHPAHVRSMILGGVNSPRFKLPLPFARARQTALDGVFAACSADRSCHAAYPRLRDEFAAVRTRVLAAPARARVSVAGFPPATVSMDYATFAERIGMMLYAGKDTAALPALIHAAFRHAWKPFFMRSYAVVLDFYKPAPVGVARGFYLSVTCAENVPFITPADVARETAHTFAGPTRVRLQQAACRVWHVPAVRRDFIRPVVTGVPTIMFSNEFDPATPVWIARADLPGFSHGRQILDHQFGHLEDWDCFLTIADSFAASGDVARVADRCVARRTSIVFDVPKITFAAGIRTDE